MAFENIVGKGENTGYQHFLLFPQSFLPFQTQNLKFLPAFNFSSANVFNLVQPRKLSFGKGLKWISIVMNDDWLIVQWGYRTFKIRLHVLYSLILIETSFKSYLSLHCKWKSLSLSQTSPGFYVSAV